MSTLDKNFKVKNGLDVAGDATVGTQIILNSVPIAFDSISKRLKIFIDNQWELIPVAADLFDISQPFDGGSPSTIYSGILTLDPGTVL